MKTNWQMEGGITGKNITEALSKVTSNLPVAEVTDLTITKVGLAGTDIKYEFIARGLHL